MPTRSNLGSEFRLETLRLVYFVSRPICGCESGIHSKAGRSHPAAAVPLQLRTRAIDNAISDFLGKERAALRLTTQVVYTITAALAGCDPVHIAVRHPSCPLEGLRS